MPVKYYLKPNPITPDPNDQSARVQPNQILGIDDIVKRIIRRGTTVNEADARSVMLLAFEEIAEAVAEGNNVNTTLVNIKPSIKGVFANVNDTFDPSRHTLRASVSGGTLLASVMSNASVQKTDSFVTGPDIVRFHDVKTNAGNQATVGNIGIITGTDLKFNPTGADEGIYFIDSTDNTEVKVTEIAQRTEGKLTFTIPATLHAGTIYYVEVRRAYTKDNVIRTDRYDQSLTAA